MTVIRTIEAILGRDRKDADEGIGRRPIPNDQSEVSGEKMDPIIGEEDILTRAIKAAGEDLELRLGQP